MFLKAVLKQSVTKIVPFLVNLKQMRKISRTIAIDEFAVPAIHFHVFYQTLLQVREGLRRSSLLISSAGNEENSSSVFDDDDDERNGADERFFVVREYLGMYVRKVVVVAFALACVAFAIQKKMMMSDSGSDDYERSIVMIVIGGIIELLAEPYYIDLCLFKDKIFARAVAETVGTFMKTVAFAYAVETMMKSASSSSSSSEEGEDSGEYFFRSINIAFAFSQFVHSVCVSFIYFTSSKIYYYYYNNGDGDDGNMKKRVSRRRRRRRYITKENNENNKNNIKKKNKKIMDSFTYQSYLKLVLAEGERFVLLFVCTSSYSSMSSSLDDLTKKSKYETAMGVFGLISNLGSLFVRLILQPFEEIAFASFTNNNNNNNNDKKRRENFMSVLSVSVLVGTVAFLIGPIVSRDVLYVLYGKNWAKDSWETLAAYAMLILPLSINGICEGFAHAVMDEKSLKMSNTWLILCSAVNCSFGLFFLTKVDSISGATGLVLGNFISLCVRIYLTTTWLKRSKKYSFEWKQCMPSFMTVSVLIVVVVSTCTKLTSTTGDDEFTILKSVKKIALLTMICIITIVKFERTKFMKLFKKEKVA
jgi:oligosaccharide translocation protein RFT1